MDWTLFSQISIWIFGSIILVSAGVNAAIEKWKGRQ